MGWKEKGIEDGRSGRPYQEPKKDLIDHLGLGYSDKDVEQQKKEYAEGYPIGTQQRLADSNEKKK